MKSCRPSDDVSGVGDITTLQSAKTITSHPGVKNDDSPQHIAGAIPAASYEPEYLNAVLMNLPIAVITLNQYGYISFCNDMAARLFECKLVNQLWRNIVEYYIGPLLDGDELALSNGRLVKLITGPLNNKCGQILIFVDITKDRNIKNLRDHYSRLTELGEMAARLAHQLRTPLSSSMLYLSNLKKSIDSSAAEYSSLEKGLSGLKQIASMIDDMLIFSKKSVKGDECYETTSLVQDIEVHTYSLTSNYECDVQIESQTNCKSIKVNRNALKAAITNLIKNACQACSERKKIMHRENDNFEEYTGKVEVSISEYNESVHIKVSDNGKGMHEDVLSRIQEPFYTTRSDGTGLGFSVVKSVIEAHGGSVKVESSVMQGTEITLSLPVCY